MKVLHISTSDVDGGAARGAFWLHQALKAQGVDSAMLVDRKNSGDDAVHAPAGATARLASSVRSRLDQLPLKRYQKTDDSYWTIGWVPNQVERMVRRIDPDVVHIHWTGDGFMPIETLQRLDYPLVWTLRDMWGFTGGCHYTAGCEGYTRSCGNCPQLQSGSENDLSRWIWERKQRAWRNVSLWLVPISGWLADCARASELFRDRPIEVIPNGLDCRRFRPTDKVLARQLWGLPQDKHLVLYGAIDSTRDPRKGYRQLHDALQILGEHGWGDRIELVVFGASSPIDDIHDLKTHFVGHLHDDASLSLLYSSADVMVAPSLQEAFGKTMIEAMACGTPVVAFASGGPVDIVEHGRNGYLATPFSAEDLATGIAWCLEDPVRPTELGRNGRIKVEQEFDIAIVAERYRALYRRVLRRAAA